MSHLCRLQIKAFVATSGNTFIANLESVIDPSWYVDSGASNHVITDHSSLTNSFNYGGKENVVGNRNELPISHCKLTTDARVLNLKNVLCVFEVTKHLISVSKLMQDNRVFIEFHPGYYLIKDINTDKVVLKGELNKDLYKIGQIRATNSASNLFDVRLELDGKIMTCSTTVGNASINALSKSIFNQRLGHPFQNFLNDVVKSYNLPINVNDSVNFCEACSFEKS